MAREAATFRDFVQALGHALVALIDDKAICKIHQVICDPQNPRHKKAIKDLITLWKNSAVIRNAIMDADMAQLLKRDKKPFYEALSDVKRAFPDNDAWQRDLTQMQQAMMNHMTAECRACGAMRVERAMFGPTECNCTYES